MNEYLTIDIINAVKADDHIALRKATPFISKSTNPHANCINIGKGFYRYLDQLKSLCFKYNANNCTNYLFTLDNAVEHYSELLLDAILFNDLKALDVFITGELNYDVGSLVQAFNNRQIPLNTKEEHDAICYLIKNNPQPWVSFLESKEEATLTLLKPLCVTNCKPDTLMNTDVLFSLAFLTPLVTYHSDKLSLVTADALYALTMAGIISSVPSRVNDMWVNSKLDIKNKRYNYVNAELTKRVITNTPALLYSACRHITVPVFTITSVINTVKEVLVTKGCVPDNSIERIKDTSFIKYSWAQEALLLKLSDRKNFLSFTYEAKDLVSMLTSNCWINDLDNLTGFVLRLAELSTWNKEFKASFKCEISTKLSRVNPTFFAVYSDLIELNDLLTASSAKKHINALNALYSKRYHTLACHIMKDLTLKDFTEDSLNEKRLSNLLKHYNKSPIELMGVITNKTTQKSLLKLMQ